MEIARRPGLLFSISSLTLISAQRWVRKDARHTQLAIAGLQWRNGWRRRTDALPRRRREIDAVRSRPSVGECLTNRDPENAAERVSGSRTNSHRARPGMCA